MKRLVICLSIIILSFSLPLFSQEQAGSGSSPSSENTSDGTMVDETAIRIGGQEDPAEDGQAEVPDSSLGSLSIWSFLRMILVLGLVVGAIYLIFHFLKKAGGSKFKDSDLIKIIGTKQISANKYLYLVEVGGLLYLVGSGENGMQLVSEITRQEVVDELLIQAAANPEVPKKNFADMFSGMFRGGGSSGFSGIGGGGGSAIGSADFLKKQRERLKNIKNSPGI
ncbi:MAG: FliO/MopB family protein [Spirochaetia bacterium]